MSVKTLRFGPLPDAMLPGGMTPPPETWTRFIDIPTDTRVRVISMPSGQIIFDGPVTRSYSRDFDPGKYKYVMQKALPMAEDATHTDFIRAEGEFLIDVTAEQWQRLAAAAPRAASASNTSDGPVWVCNMPGCGSKSGTRLAAYLHEAREHFGIDPIKEPEKQIDVDVKGLELKAELGRASKNRGTTTDADLLRGMASGT